MQQTRTDLITRDRWLAWALLTVTSVCWAGNTIFAMYAVGEVSPMLLVALRWLLVCLAVLLLARRDLRRDWPVLRANLVLLGSMGMLGYTAFNALFYSAAHSTSALNMAIIQAAIPAFVAVGSVTFLRTALSPRQLMGVLLTLTGAIVVAVRGELAQLLQLEVAVGDLLMVIAGALYAGYTLMLPRLPQIAPLSLFGVFAAGALLAAIPLAAGEALVGAAQLPTPTGWLLIAAVALFPSTIAQLLFMRGVALIGPAQAGVFVNLVPIFASLGAIGLLGETFRGFHATAFLLVLAGIAFAQGPRPDSIREREV